MCEHKHWVIKRPGFGYCEDCGYVGRPCSGCEEELHAPLDDICYPVCSKCGRKFFINEEGFSMEIGSKVYEL